MSPGFNYEKLRMQKRIRQHGTEQFKLVSDLGYTKSLDRKTRKLDKKLRKRLRKKELKEERARQRAAADSARSSKSHRKEVGK